jgi:membrane protein implicated in regulation of membrane protease activity
MLGAAGFLGLFALIFLSIALAYAISWFGIGLGWGFFIVGMLYLVVGAVLALLGKKQLSKVGPPEKTIATVKDDLAWAKHPTRP